MPDRSSVRVLVGRHALTVALSLTLTTTALVAGGCRSAGDDSIGSGEPSNNPDSIAESDANPDTADTGASTGDDVVVDPQSTLSNSAPAGSTTTPSESANMEHGGSRGAAAQSTATQAAADEALDALAQVEALLGQLDPDLAALGADLTADASATGAADDPAD